MKKVIIGLGNPGKQYEWTRHNLGFIVVDALKEELAPDVPWEKFTRPGGHHKANVLMVKVNQAEQSIWLVKPQSFMNESGSEINDFLQFHKLTVADILVIHDDLDMEFLKTRKAEDSSSGGHNGVQSIIDALGTQKFSRLKIGIKNLKRSLIPAERFVLMPFGFLEKRAVKKFLSEKLGGLL